MSRTSHHKLITEMFSKKILDQNIEALTSYDYYKETANLIELVDLALGKKSTFEANTGSTLNCEIDQHGIASTTA